MVLGIPWHEDAATSSLPFSSNHLLLCVSIFSFASYKDIHMSLDTKPTRITQVLCSVLNWLHYQFHSFLSSTKVPIRMNRTCAMWQPWAARKSIFSASLCPIPIYTQVPTYHFHIKMHCCGCHPALCFKGYVKSTAHCGQFWLPGNLISYHQIVSFVPGAQRLPGAIFKNYV